MEKPKVITLPDGRKAVDVSQDYYLTTIKGRTGLFPKNDLSGENTPLSVPEAMAASVLPGLLGMAMKMRDETATALIVEIL
ncbi:hypothetical protein C5B42_01480 [Candidatus Cerribacteria bacterium 'Amazon FNV 2010 28 9']|uniref:Uncharacterized protein n=1 Tax=Candidatus Cerribacteria bacterium 'Amazon FNV 2010 28 9' TaxID=2081795 RepID=A0A317JPV9_9BACT|nr:MAG: hypothetical protein C5B42_01480 [Candidatus Cerribacteria bacterium 'Amazon FNV 2010 28 9']